MSIHETAQTMVISAKKVRPMPADEAALVRVKLQIFMEKPQEIHMPQLRELMETLSVYYANRYCGQFDYFRYRRHLTAEYSKRLNAGG